MQDKKGDDADQAARALREISLISEIGRIVGSTLDIEEVYGRFCAKVKKLLSFDRLVINIHDKKNGCVTVAYAYGAAVPGRNRGAVFPIEGSVSGYVARKRTVISGVPNPSIFADCIAAAGEGMRSFMAVPLISRNEVIASLHFRSRTANAYGKQERAVARRIGIQITGAIANSQLYADLKKTEELLEKSEELYRMFVKNASDIILKTDARGFLTYVNPAAERVTGYVESELIGRNYLEIVRSDKREEAARFLGRQFVKKVENTYLEIPIEAKNGNVVWLGQNVQLVFDDKGDVIGFQAVSRDVTDRRLAEEKLKESEEKYRTLSIEDGLTRLYNSRYFYKILDDERSRVARYNQRLTLLFIDIDDFKKYNDVYGHLEGDAVLSRFGQLVKKSLRVADTAFRYGGEEFVILLPMTGKMEGVQLAERIRAAFEREIFVPCPQSEVQMTLSIGVAQFHREETAEAFVKRADERMYSAKQAGKNRIAWM